MVADRRRILIEAWSIFSLLLFLIQISPAVAQSVYVALVSLTDQNQIDELIALDVEVVNWQHSKVTVILTDDELDYLRAQGYSILVKKEYSSPPPYGPPRRIQILLQWTMAE